MVSFIVLLSVVFHYLIYVNQIAESAPTQNNERFPTLLISFDGFQAGKLDQFLSENPASNLKKYFVDVGVKADYMIPSFPSLTFPSIFIYFIFTLFSFLT